MTAATRRRQVAELISFAFRDGVWVPSLMAARASHDLDLEHGSWLAGVAESVAGSFGDIEHVVSWVLTGAVEAELAQRSIDASVDAWIDDVEPPDGVSPWECPPSPLPPEMREQRWPVPPIATATQLADYLNLDLASLLWHADVKSLERAVVDENLRHYDYYWLAKRRGGARLVEAPKQNLKYLQRKILRDVLNVIPAHDAAHGFRRGRSIQSYASPHTAREMVIRLDLRDFFSTVPAGRVFGIFRTAGYPDDVAHLLTGLTTNAAPNEVLQARPDRGERADLLEPVLRGPHLPQGAPTSPALANLAAYRLDLRLAALAERFDARYTRYADDLAVSGDSDFAQSSGRFLHLAEVIVRDEGFRLNTEKTRRRTQAQRQVLTGMVVNKRLNVHRHEYDRLRAILHDVDTNGATAANRTGHPQFRSHIEGRISFVQATNPARARKLWVAFDRLDWSTSRKIA